MCKNLRTVQKPSGCASRLPESLIFLLYVPWKAKRRVGGLESNILRIPRNPTKFHRAPPTKTPQKLGVVDTPRQKKTTVASIFTENLVAMRNVSHFGVFLANWLLRMDHTKSEVFCFWGNLTARDGYSRDCNPNCLCPWEIWCSDSNWQNMTLLFGWKSDFSLYPLKILYRWARRGIISHFRYHPTAFSKTQFLEKIRLWTHKIRWQTRATSNHSPNVAVLPLCISVSSVCVWHCVRAPLVDVFVADFPKCFFGCLLFVFCCVIVLFGERGIALLFFTMLSWDKKVRTSMDRDFVWWSLTHQHLGSLDVHGYDFEHAARSTADMLETYLWTA